MLTKKEKKGIRDGQIASKINRIKREFKNLHHSILMAQQNVKKINKLLK